MQNLMQRILRIVSRPTSQAIWLALIYILIASTICLLRHWSYNSWTLDLGAFTQSLSSTLDGHLLYNTPCGMSQLGYHFQPILFLLVPIFWIAPHAETLLIVQSIALGFSGYLVYRLARIQQLDHGTALLVEVLFLLSPLLHGVNFFDFHPVALAVPTLLVMIIGLVQRRWILFSIGLVLSLMTKEDVIMALGVFGAAMLFAQYTRTKKLERPYLVILISSVVTYALAVLIATIVSGFDTPPMIGYGELRYSYIGEPPGQFIWGALKAFFSLGSIFLLLAYFWPLGFLPLLSPVWVSPALFILLKDLAATDGSQKTLHQYPAAAIPFLFMALIQVLNRQDVREALDSIWGKSRRLLPIALILMVLGLNFLVNMLPSSTIREANWPSLHDRATSTIIGLIPDGASVTAPYHIFSHLCTRTITYSPYETVKPNAYHGDFGFRDVDTEYVIIDLRWMRDYKKGYQEQGEDWANHIAGQYGLLAHIDGISLLKQDYDDVPVLVDLDQTSGFNATIYSDKDFTEKAVETHFFSADLQDLGIAGVIPGIVPQEEWSMRLRGYIHIPEDGAYEFHLRSDGGATVRVDNHTVVGPGVLSRDFEVSLDQGFHEIVLDYVQHSGGYFDLNLGGLEVHRTPTE